MQEHRNLRMDSFELIERVGEVPYLVYRESVSKNHPGGLKNRHDKGKVVMHHANTERPDRCLIQFFKKYCEHWPEGVDNTYLTPIATPKTNVWYKTTHLLGRTHSPKLSSACAERLGSRDTNLTTR